MADTHETTADIIAWLRRPREGENTYLTLWRDEIADRLEAALKRDTKELRVEIERLKEERNYSGVRERERLRANGFAIVPKEQLERGDASKLREAMVTISKVSDDWRLYVNTMPAALDHILGLAQAALAAPPRNCDRPECATTKAAQDVWRREDGGKTAYYEWLLATATEKEGGAK